MNSKLPLLNALVTGGLTNATSGQLQTCIVLERACPSTFKPDVAHVNLHRVFFLNHPFGSLALKRLYTSPSLCGIRLGSMNTVLVFMDRISASH